MLFPRPNDLFRWNFISGQIKRHSKSSMRMENSSLKGSSPTAVAATDVRWKDASQSFVKTKDLNTPAQPPTGRGRGRGGPNRAAASNIIQGRQNMRTIDKQDKNIWIHLVHYLRKEKLLPVVIFV